MPYIDHKIRDKIDYSIQMLADDIDKVVQKENINPDGMLNYAITELLSSVFFEFDGKINYNKINSAVGVLECVKCEFYRRLASAYEDKKIEENGDINTYNNVSALIK